MLKKNLNRFIPVIILVCLVAVSACRNVKDPDDPEKSNYARNNLCWIYTNNYGENLDTSGYSGSQVDLFREKANSHVSVNNLSDSTDSGQVAPAVLKGAMDGLSDGSAGLAVDAEKLAVLNILVASIIDDLDVVVSPSASSESQSYSVRQESSSASQMSVLRSMVSICIQNLDDVGFDTANITSTLDSVLDTVMGNLANAGVAEDDLSDVLQGITEGAVGAVNEAGISGDDIKTVIKSVVKSIASNLKKAGVKDEDISAAITGISKGAVSALDEAGFDSSTMESAVEAVTGGVLLGLKEEGKSSVEIAALADEVARGAASGLSDAGLSETEVDTIKSKVTDQVKEGLKEAGVDDEDINQVESNIEEAAGDTPEASSDSSSDDLLSSTKAITAFKFLAATNGALSSDITATISGATILATVPTGTNVTALVATFTTTGSSVSVNSTTQVSGATVNVFSSIVTYRVIAADGSTQDYSVNITVASNSYTWTQATSSAAWPVRGSFSSVVFDNKVWVLGGEGSTLKTDVWYSSDGVNWTQATSNAWSSRRGHASVVYDNKIWVFGGCCYKSDVWYSSDGINWTEATADASWSDRDLFPSVVFDNKMWIFGGYSSGHKNDVWYSSDGVNWTGATQKSCTVQAAKYKSSKTSFANISLTTPSALLHAVFSLPVKTIDRKKIIFSAFSLFQNIPAPLMRRFMIRRMALSTVPLPVGSPFSLNILY
jgi:hypothetical protein